MSKTNIQIKLYSNYTYLFNNTELHNNYTIPRLAVKLNHSIKIHLCSAKVTQKQHQKWH